MSDINSQVKIFFLPKRIPYVFCFQVYQDAIQLQKFYIHLRDELCDNGSLLRSSALLFNEDRLQQELTRERNEKNASNNQNSTSATKSTDTDEKKDAVCFSLIHAIIMNFVFCRSHHHLKIVHIPKVKLIT